MKRKKLLFLTTQLPFPPISGGTIKSYNLLKHLSETYDLYLGCLLKGDDFSNVELLRQRVPLKGYFGDEVMVGRTPLNLLKSVLFSTSFNTYRNKSERLMEMVEETCKEMHAIIIDHYEMFQYVPKSYAGKVIFHSHNAEFLLWERMAILEKNPIKKLLLSYESKRVKSVESAIAKRANLFFATPHDIKIFKKSSVESATFASTYHLGDDTLLDKAQLDFNQTENAIMFIGTLSWEPNVNGLLWFFDEVWPLLKKLKPTVTVYVIGMNADSRLLKKSDHDKNIVFTGFIEDAEEYYIKSRVSFIPLKFGSGMKVKVLESMYRGMPMVLTSIGAEGIALRSGEDAFIADEPQVFAEKVNQLLEDEIVWKKFRNNSRNIAEEKYTWSSLFKEMNKELEKVLSQ